MSDKKKRMRRLGVGVGAGAAVAAALLVLGLVGLAQTRGAGAAGASTYPWIKPVVKDLRKRGYDWLKISVDDNIATVVGEAPDVDSRQFGVEAAETAIHQADEKILVVVDATHLAGGEAGVGAALQTLGPKPAPLDCQTGFQGVLSGRTINFTPGSAELTPDNKRLLDALSAVAIRCRSYAIEVGGHTDASGSAGINRALSQARAESVESYMQGKGVPTGVLTAKGYGSSRPIDPARTPEADARNRRIEFAVAAH